MTNFKDLDDNTQVAVPSDLVEQATGRVAKRVRTRRLIAGGLAGLLVVIFASVAFAASSNAPGTDKLNTTDKSRRTELRKQDTSTTVVSGSSVTQPTAPSNSIDDDNGDDDSVSTSRPGSSPTTTFDDSGDDSEDDDSFDDSSIDDDSSNSGKGSDN